MYLQCLSVLDDWKAMVPVNRSYISITSSSEGELRGLGLAWSDLSSEGELRALAWRGVISALRENSGPWPGVE